MPFRLKPRTRLLLAVLAISALVGVVGAKYNARGHLQGGVATAHMMVDFPSASIIDRRAQWQDVTTLQKRAELYGRMMTTDQVLADIARHVGAPAGQLSAVGRLTDVPIPMTQPDSEVRAQQIVASLAPYRLELQTDPNEPILAIYAAAPSADAAQRLATGAIAGLHDYLVGLARQQGFPLDQIPQLRQIGVPHGAPINGHAKVVIAAVTFLVAFVLTAVALLTAAWLIRRRRAAPKRVAAERPRPRALDDWPHTNRLLPWALAAFMSILWLTPFDRIQLTVHTPIDMKLDRLLLPLVVAIWVLAFATGGDSRPRLRMTWIHVAVFAFTAIAFLSVVFDARYLNQTMELMLSLKKLPLLLSYISVFVIMSSSIRPTEVRSFLTLTGVLAVIVGLGIVYEYRLDTNIFSYITQKVLVGPLVLNGSAAPGANLDSLGRRGITGPTAQGVEAVAVLALALPVMIVGLLGDGRRKQRILYGAAVCILIAGMFATGRKSGLLAAVAVLVTLGYFRRRELLSLAPIGLVIAFAVTVLSPGAIHGIIAQFVRSDSSSVATTSDRVSDYDAIRPDVWTHLLFGRGFGSYNHDTYRVLDSEILSRTIECGVIGLLAFLLIGISVILAGRGTIARRDPRYAPIALVGAASAAAFLVSSFLFDVTGFPHVTYIFFTIAGLVSVVIGHDARLQRELPPRAERMRARRRQPLPDRASPRRHDALV